jgi:hypothetical protein
MGESEAQKPAKQHAIVDDCAPQEDATRCIESHERLPSSLILVERSRRFALNLAHFAVTKQ